MLDAGPPTADCRLWTVDCGLWTADCRLRTADCRLPTADCEWYGGDGRRICVWACLKWVDIKVTFY